MGYKFVPKKEYSLYRNEFDLILRDMQTKMREKYGLTMIIRLVGSGANNCVTKNTATGLWDLDYNLIIMKCPDDMIKDPGKLKNRIMSIIDRIVKSGKYLKGYTISPGKNSTVPITYNVRKGNKHIMSVDVAVIRNIENQSLRLKFDKPPINQYIWNELSSIMYSDQDIKLIKKNGMKDELNKRYLDKKESDSETASFILFIQAVNETLQLIRNMGKHSTPIRNEKEVKKMAKVSGNNHSKSQMNHHSNQKNPNNSAHRAAQNNRSNQLNPNNAKYKGGNNSKSGK